MLPEIIDAELMMGGKGFLRGAKMDYVVANSGRIIHGFVEVVLDNYHVMAASGFAVFVVSIVLHTMLNIHGKDFKSLDKDALPRVQKALEGVKPGTYMFPCRDQKNKKQQEAWARGPKGTVRIFTPDYPLVGMQCIQSLWYNCFVSFFVVALFELANIENEFDAFVFISLLSHLSYFSALGWEHIWYQKPDISIATSFIDALLYAWATAGVVCYFKFLA